VALGGASAAGGAPPGPAPLACFGEIGLTGELRSVGHADRRLAEAAKFGLAPVVAPRGAGAGATEVASLRAAVRAAGLSGRARARPATATETGAADPLDEGAAHPLDEGRTGSETAVAAASVSALT
jgi:hypothetical protein